MRNKVPSLAGCLLLCLVATTGWAADRSLAAGAIASPDIYGARAARQVLREGGNAVDAAVATGFVLAVTYPEAGNLGGGGLMTLYVAGKPYFLDYRETAPRAASERMYLDRRGDPVPGLSTMGNLSSGVPGTVAGLAEAHRRFGALSWRRDLAPAIAMARDGFIVPPGLAAERYEAQGDFSTTNFAAWSRGLTTGRRFRQPQLAATLQRIADGGPRAFYAGRTADLIVAQMARGPGKGLITHADLAAYKPVWRTPIVGHWEGFTVITAPPPSSGGVALLQMLRMKEDAARLFAGQTLNSAQYLHLVAEIEKRVFADRAEYMGDPDFTPIPVAALLAPDYLARRARQINPVKPSATASVTPGLEKPQTTHYSIVDKWGNAVSNTYTLNGDFGSGVVVEGAGFLMNDEMDDFSVKPGTPNQFGVVGGDANAIAPLKRPLSSMTPTVLHPGRAGGHGHRHARRLAHFHLGLPGAGRRLRLPSAAEGGRRRAALSPSAVAARTRSYWEPYAPFPAALAAALKARGYDPGEGLRHRRRGD